MSRNRLVGTIVFLAGIWLLKSSGGGTRGAGITSIGPAPQERLEEPVPRGQRAGFRQIAAGADEIRRDGQLREFAIRWVNENPGNALEFCDDQPPGEVKDSFRRHLLVAWAKSDAEAALEWSDQRPGPSDRRATRETICIAVAETDPRHALELALGHNADQEESGGLLGNFAMRWAGVDLERARAWVKEQPPGEWHDRLVARVAFVLAKSDPHAAAKSVAEDMESGPGQTEAVISVLHQWGALDVDRAAAWVADFPPGQLRDRAVTELEGCRRMGKLVNLPK